MKIETPQISWHGCESDKGRNAPLLSCSMIESGLEDLEGTYSQVLATAGNDSVVNLWKLSFNNDHNAESSSSSHHGVHVVEDVPPNRTNSGSVGVGPSSNTTVNQNNSIVKIQHLTSLKRHERSVNALKFSPDGLTLATAGDGGSIVLWSIPHDKRGGSNGQHFWSLVSKESDVECRILPSGGSEGVTCEDIFDLQWSPCSSRFVVCSLDHCLLVFENQHHADGTNGGIGSSGGSTSLSVTSGWKCVASARDHTHYVQGVAYDPLNVYVCSQASDRSVRVYSQKEASAKNKNKFDLQKEATIKFWPNAPSDEKKEVSGETTESSAGSTIKKAARRNHLFAEEATVESFFRRLAWTADGAFLIAPAGIMPKRAAEGDSAAPSDDSNNASSFGTYLFARHCFDRPAAALPGLTKPSVAVRPCPVLFQCPSSGNGGNGLVGSSSTKSQRSSPRSVFAVLTLDSVILYDTYHSAPLMIVRGFHYAGLTDCAWTADGRTLVVTSSDGYISFLRWESDEVGNVYHQQPGRGGVQVPSTITPKTVLESHSSQNTKAIQASTTDDKATKDDNIVASPVPVTPKEKEDEADIGNNNTHVRKDAAGKKRLTPTFVSTLEEAAGQGEAEISKEPTAAKAIGAQVTIAAATAKETPTSSAQIQIQKPMVVKKKRIQPTLVSSER